MSDLPTRGVADDLDPRQYAAHVVKTAMLLERLAEDVRAQRERAENSDKVIGDLRAELASLSKDFAVFRAETANKLSLRGTIAAGVVAVMGAIAALIWYIVMK